MEHYISDLKKHKARILECIVDYIFSDSCGGLKTFDKQKFIPILSQIFANNGCDVDENFANHIANAVETNIKLGYFQSREEYRCVKIWLRTFLLNYKCTSCDQLTMIKRCKDCSGIL